MNRSTAQSGAIGTGIEEVGGVGRVSEWQEFKFGALCSIKRGASPRPINDWMAEEGTPWVKISDATSSQSRFIKNTGDQIKPEGEKRSFIVYPGDLILSNSATPGIPKFLGIRACVHDGWLILRDFNGLDKYFAYYLLLNDRKKLVAQGNGSVFTNLKTEILKDHDVRIPPLSIQCQISAILSAFDDKIELNQQINRTLEQMARALFQSWFVDFDPVRAKMRGETPQGMDVETAALFPDELIEMDGREVPIGWSIQTVGNLIATTIGGDWGEGEVSETNSEAVRVIRGTDIWKIKEGDFSKVPVRYVSKSKYAKRKLLAGDLVLEVSGGSKDQPTGRALRIDHEILNELNGEVVPTSFCRLLRPVGRLESLFLGVYLDKIYDEGRTWLYQNQSTGISNFQTPAFLGNEQFVFPTQGLLEIFTDIINEWLSLSLNRQSAHLVQLRDSLLPRLLSGEVSVSEWAEAAQEVMA